MRAPLTPIEQQVYHYLLDFLAEHTFQPSVRDIGARLRIPSTKSVTDLLASLERKGYVERSAGRSRGVRLLGYSGSAGSAPVPLMQLDEHGTLVTSEYLTLDRRFVGADDAFLLRVDAGAPHGLGLRAGDLVVVHPSARAPDGELTAVRVGNVVLVRAVQHRGAMIELGGDGESEPTLLGAGDSYQVLGVVGAVLRHTRPAAGAA